MPFRDVLQYHRKHSDQMRLKYLSFLQTQLRALSTLRVTMTLVFAFVFLRKYIRSCMLSTIIDISYMTLKFDLVWDKNEPIRSHKITNSLFEICAWDNTKLKIVARWSYVFFKTAEEIDDNISYLYYVDKKL